MGDNMNNEEMGYPGQRFSAGSGSSSMDPFAPNPATLQYVPNEFGITHSETSPMYRYNNPAEPDSGVTTDGQLLSGTAVRSESSVWPEPDVWSESTVWTEPDVWTESAIWPGLRSGDYESTGEKSKEFRIKCSGRTGRSVSWITGRSCALACCV